jgi:riboflavin synthase
MFTGLVEALGRVTSAEVSPSGLRVVIAAKRFFRGAKVGDSIAVGGVCLTAVKLSADRFAADLSTETLKLTTAGKWKLGTRVNLERSLRLSTPLGGHLVSGHVDGIGKVIKSRDVGDGRALKFQAPKALARYIARKGSICVDGVSLTVNAVAGNRFDLMIIPHTLSHTTLGHLRPGNAVNLEVDLVARYLERLLAARED